VRRQSLAAQLVAGGNSLPVESQRRPSNSASLRVSLSWHGSCSFRVRHSAALGTQTMDSILGIHEAALLYRAKRMDVLAANLANADTPHFQARDLDFASALDGAFSAATRLTRTDPRHIELDPLARGDALKYRVPHQPSLDGNTVEADLELARYAENAVSYQASLLFAGGRISTLRTALTGGR
jgi:flagellar basal-body rod protein FlgB